MSPTLRKCLSFHEKITPPNKNHRWTLPSKSPIFWKEHPCCKPPVFRFSSLVFHSVLRSGKRSPKTWIHNLPEFILGKPRQKTPQNILWQPMWMYSIYMYRYSHPQKIVAPNWQGCFFFWGGRSIRGDQITWPKFIKQNFILKGIHYTSIYPFLSWKRRYIHTSKNNQPSGLGAWMGTGVCGLDVWPPDWSTLYTEVAVNLW